MKHQHMVKLKISAKSLHPIIEVQRIVVLGSTALFTMVWQLRIHTHRDEGWDNFLFVETE